MTEPDLAKPSKEQLMGEYISARQVLLRAFDGLTGRELEQKIDGQWTVKDVIAHIVAWDLNALDNARALISGDMEKVKMDEEEEFNKAAVDMYKDRSGDQMLTELHKVTDQVVEFLDAADEAQLFRDSNLVFRGQVVRASRGFTYAHHDLEHANQILDWRRGR